MKDSKKVNFDERKNSTHIISNEIQVNEEEVAIHQEEIKENEFEFDN